MTLEFRRSFLAHWLSAAAMFASVTAVGQTPLAMSQPLTVDAALRIGKLDNGFTYYIRPVKSAAPGIELQLVVKAGNDQEDADQPQIAHVTEHVNFVGTSHFPGDLHAHLAKFGIDKNNATAITSSNLTSYWIKIPGGDAAVLQMGLRVTRDWAQDALLRDEGIDHERKTVIEELRPYLNNRQAGLPEQYWPMLLNGAGPVSYYAPEHRQSELERQLLQFKPEVVRRFHADWYRPDLQALIVVGNVDVAQVEAQIKALFSDLKAPANPRKRENYAAELTGHDRFMALTHPDLTELEIQIHEKRLEDQARLTVADHRAALIANLYDLMINERFTTLRLRPDVSISLISSEACIHPLPNLAVTRTRIVAAVSGWQKALQAVVMEIERASRFGFTQGEFQAVKEKLLNRRSGADGLLTRLRSDSENYFIAGSVPMAPEVELELTRKLLAEMSPQTVSQTVQEWKRDGNRDIVVLAPASVQQALPDQAMIAALIKQASSTSLDPLPEGRRIGNLLLAAHEVPRKVSRVKLESENDGMGITIARLTRNGVKVVMKPGVGTGRIAIRLFGPGGTSLVPDAEYLSAYAASGVVVEGGVGGFSKAELDRYSSARNLRVLPYMENAERGLRGEAKSTDFEALLQLVYLYCARPNRDRAAFERHMRSWQAELEAESTSASQALTRKTLALDSDTTLRNSNAVTPQNLGAIDFDVAQRIFRERFGTAGDLTLVVVGDFSPQQVLPIVAKYLGALPRGAPRLSPPPVAEVKAGTNHEILHGGTANTADVAIVFRGNRPAEMRVRLELEAVGRILNAMIQRRLRGVEAATYSPIAALRIREDRYRIVTRFQCAPENAQRLIAAVYEEIARLKLQGPAAQDLSDFIAADEQRAELASPIEFWLLYLAGQVREHAPLDAMLQRGVLRSGLNPTVLAQAARRYLDDDYRSELILLPAQKDAQVPDAAPEPG